MFDRLEDYRQFEAFLATFTNYERVPSPAYDKETMGTERMRAFLELLGDPHRAQPAVHVAGSKGKGSTCLALEAILLAEGYRVGTYLSPHVEHLRERVRVNGAPVEEGELVEATNGALGALERLRGRGPAAFPSFFELLTALAMSIFRARRVDWAIYEVGLGGRLDATNVVSPAVSAVTAIELEHTEQLGTTLAAIAREKAGIVKPGIPVVVGDLEEEALREVAEIARARGAPMVVCPKSAVSRAGTGLLRIEDPEATIPAGRIVGPGLRADLGIAIAIARAVLAGAGRRLDRAARAAAISGLELP
ncbi:MAG: bifunctional folylpolyglutamate synthase/dihydrofolate synthase, partial [Planctomycetota bacterium]